MISFTEAALHVLKESVDPTDFVRVSVQGGGCSGMLYNLEIELDCRDDDTVLELEEVKICIDPQSLFFLSETTVDYETTLTASGFKFMNDKADRTCGCGKSFSCG